jgi:hypothetical protein
MPGPRKIYAGMTARVFVMRAHRQKEKKIDTINSSFTFFGGAGHPLLFKVIENRFSFSVSLLTIKSIKS